MVRALLAVGAAKDVEAPLLGGKLGSRRPDRALFQGAVHALMAAVLLRLAGIDELGQDAS